MKPKWWDRFFQHVCELPDRNSPDDEPDAIVATEHELLNAYFCTMEELTTTESGREYTNVETIKLVVDLTKAKVDILRLKADDYTWACHVDADTKAQLEDTLTAINAQLAALRSNAEITGG